MKNIKDNIPRTFLSFIMVFKFDSIKVLFLEGMLLFLSFGIIFKMMKKQIRENPPMIRKGVCHENRSIITPERGIPMRVDPAQASSVIPIICPLLAKGTKLPIKA